jgi:hypothetical protein
MPLRGDLPASKRGGVYRLREQDVAGYVVSTRRSAAGHDVTAARYLPEQLLVENAAENSSYVIRSDLQAAVIARLLDPAVHIVTVTGPGGAHKSRLSVAASSEIAGQDLGHRIAAALSGTRRLIVLDNFEQILPAAPLVSWKATIAPE